MAATREKQSLDLVLVHEGGYSNHPADPGGPTMKGVTQRVYDGYRKRKGLTTRSVKSIQSAELLDIYDRQYWDPIKGDQLPEGVDYVLFDGAVNSGPNQSGKWLQRALGGLYHGVIDGNIGEATLAAVGAVNNHDALIDRICDQRLAFLRALKTWRTFGKGWAARVAEVRAAGKAWASGEKVTVSAVSFTDGGSAKASVQDAQTPPSTAVSDAAAGGGIASGVAGGTIQTLQDQLTPFSSASQWITYAVIALAVISAIMVVGGGLYSVYARRKAARIADALSSVP
ncbi:glycoside hydrolase family 108 protein [Mesorhizobium sp. M0387]|uniref:glycoside hydrolase family 108 protein n=1 Tax=Mesorhizobium sp. M0387 TaxID=2956940 RepID=UPI00333AC3D4